MDPTWTDTQGVLIIGAGAAGLRAAIAVRQAGREALVVAGRGRDDAHTVLAAGGINGVLGTRDPDDSWQQHCVDTYEEARGLSDPRAAEILAREAPQAIDELASFGCPFARTEDGSIDQRYFGAHRYRRTCYVADRTGRAVLDALYARAVEVGVTLWDQLHVTRLLVDDERCRGAYALDLRDGHCYALLADACVLATGGHSGLWERSSSRGHENLGEGMALALRSGCRLADMEFVQFHPSGMVFPEQWAGKLVSEAVRGEGAHLRNAEGERFMARYDAERMELSTRDQVALASYVEIAEGRGTEHDGVWLDASHLGRDVIDERMPAVARQYQEALGLDIAEEAMEVAPTAHYSMGGVVVDVETGATEIGGLYAAGEVTAGLHGANRLGGNSLAETVVFGRRAGQAAAAESVAPRTMDTLATVVAEASQEVDLLRSAGGVSLEPVARKLGRLLWETCGVVRTADRLQDGLQRLPGLWEEVGHGRSGGDPDGPRRIARMLSLRAAILASEVTLRGAAERCETRGAHVREDYPEPEPEARRTLVRRRPDGQLELAREAVPGLPGELVAFERAAEGVHQLLE